MKTLKSVLAIMVMIVATTGMGLAQGMVYQTHQELVLGTAGNDGLGESWVQLPNDNYVRVIESNFITTIESTAGWTEDIANTYRPCIAEYNGTIWVAMSQLDGYDVTINGTTHPAPPAGLAYTILVKLNSSGTVLDSWQAVGAMTLTNIAVLSNTEIAVVGNASLVLEHLTSPNGGGVVLIHDGTDWDTSKGFFIERPSGGGKPLVTSAQYLSNGNLALAGYTDGGTVNFGGISLPPHGSTDGFRGKITSTGTGIQAVQMAASSNDKHHLQITKADGSYMVTGTYTHPISFYNADGSVGGSLGQFPTGASHDHIYFVYYNASGVFQNAEVAYSDDAGTNLLNIDLIYGNDAFYAMIGNTNGGTMTTPTGSHNKVAPIILKFDDTGNAVWSKQFDGVGSNNPGQYGEEVLVNNDIITLCGKEVLHCDLDFDSPVVAISSTSYWCEYNDGTAPDADFTGTPTTLFEGETVSFTDISTEGSSPITTWDWTFEGGTPGTFSGVSPPSITYSSPGDYDVTLVVSDGSLSDTELKTDYIHVNAIVAPIANFSGTPTTLLEGESVSFTDASTQGTNPITSWNWTFEGGTPGTFSGVSPPSITYDSPGDYDVTLVVSDGSVSDTELKTDYIHVNAIVAPIANFSGTPTSGYAPLVVSFTDASTQGTYPITSWDWDFGDGDTSDEQHPVHTYASVGDYTVSLTVSDGSLSDTKIEADYIAVAPDGEPIADFLADPLWGILTLTTQFTDESTPGNNPLTSWDWDFGDGNTSDIQHPQHIYDFPGIYTVSLTVSDGNMSDTKTETDYISVYEELIVDAGPDMGLELDQSTQFDGSYSGGSGDITILWEGINNSIPIDDPTILDPNVGPFSDIDVYYFTLTVIDNITGCESTDEMFVDVILGIMESQYANIKVYPNPSTGLVFINSNTKLDMLIVVDITGQEIIKIKNPDNTSQINLSSFATGLYFIKIVSMGKLNTYKIEKR